MQSGAGGHEWPLCIGDYGDAPLISSCRLFLARSDVKSVNSHPPVPSKPPPSVSCGGRCWGASGKQAAEQEPSFPPVGAESPPSALKTMLADKSCSDLNVQIDT